MLMLEVDDDEPPHPCPHLSLLGDVVPPVGVVLAGTPGGPQTGPPGGGLVTLGHPGRGH